MHDGLATGRARFAFTAFAVSAAFALAACGDDDKKSSEKPKVGDCTNSPMSTLGGLEGQYKVLDCGDTTAKSKITSDATGKGVTGCPDGEGFFDVKEGEYCLGPKE